MPQVELNEQRVTPSGATLKKYASVRKLAELLSNKQTDRGRERYRRAGMTASTSFLSKALTMGISFISVPLTIHYLGAERYGVWLTISSLLMWMSLTDFGLTGNALVNMISSASAREDTETAQQYAASAFWSLVGLSVLFLCCFCTAFNWISWRVVFRVSEAVSSAELNYACLFTAIIFALNLPLGMLNSIYSAYQDGFIWNIWTIAGNLLSLISLLVVTHFQGGLPLLICAVSGTRVLVSIINAAYMFFRQYPFLKPSVFCIRWARTRELLKLGSKYTVAQLAGLGIYQSQPMIITQLLGPAQVTIFVIAQKIVTLPNDLAYIATQPFISAFSEARARGDWAWIRGAFKNSLFATITCSLLIQTVIALLAKRVIAVWAGPAAVPSTEIVIWLSVYTFIAAAMMPVGQLLCGLERADVLAISLSVCAIAISSLSVLAAHKWGLVGVAFAMAVGKLLTSTPIQIREVWRVFDRAATTAETQCESTK